MNERDTEDTYSNLLEILPSYDKTQTKIPFFTIFYATQSNTAKKFADKIADDAKILNLNCNVKNISEISLEDFNKNIFMLFFLSTYGEGGPSDDCIEFNKLLEEKSRGKHTFFEEVNNKFLHYSIFGLGSSKYEYFNQMAKKFDQIFTKNSMTRVSELGLGDDGKNINEDFKEWRKNFWKDSQNYFTLNFEKTKKISEELNLKELYEGNREEIQISFENNKPNVTEMDSNDYEFNIKRFLQAEVCQVESITELRKENINGSTLKVTYKLAPNMTYNVGDNIGVYPTNSEQSVNSILSRLNYDADSVVKITKMKDCPLKKKISIIDGYTVKELLLNIVDLSSQINKELLEKLLKYCFDEDQYASIQNILKRDNKLNEFLAKNYNIVDFLAAYDSINLPFIEFYNLMPKIAPRFYTVASSPNYTKGKFEIIISLLEWKGVNNQTKFGLTSNYYKNALMEQNSKQINTRIIVRESNFKLPKNLNDPMMFICTGTGIAPFISFFQEFSHNSHNGELTLLFGSKNKNYDFIYEEEINLFLEKQIIKKLYTAFSRDQETKFYVQDVISKSNEHIDLILQNKNTTIYICGGVSMGSEVVSTLEKLYTKEFIKKLESENRLIKELWG